MIEQDKAIFIEYCANCSSHVWCTKHDEGRYYSFYQTLKQDLEKQFEGFTVYGNTNPLTGKTIIPGLGAFEVFYKKCRVFSKLKSTSWPTTPVIASRIKARMEGQTPTGCELVDYTYDDAPVVEKKRRVISIPKQMKRTFDCQNTQNTNTSTKMESYPGTLDSIPTENPHQENRVPSWKKDTNKPNSLIEVENKIRRRVVPPMAKQDENAKKCCYHLYNSNKSAHSSGTKHAPVRANNENYYLPGNVGKSKSTMKDRNPKSLNEMSLNFQTMTDFSNVTNLYPSYVGSINIKEDDAKKKYNNRQLSVTPSTKAGSTYNKLEPLDKAGIASMGSDTKPDVPYSRRPVRSLSQDMGTLQDQEFNESTIFSQVSNEVSSVKNQLAKARKENRGLLWFPDGTSDRSSPDKFDEKILGERNKNTGGNSNQDEEYEIDPATVNKGKGNDAAVKEEETFLTRLKKMRFPEEKLSQIRASRKVPMKKKITMVPDENMDCKIEVHTSHSQITTMSSNQFNVAKGMAFKIPLKFDFKELKFLDDFCLYILKNNRPWQKINLNVNFL